MKRRFILQIALILLAIFILVSLTYHARNTNQTEDVPPVTTLSLPPLNDADYDWIGSRIYQNEALGKQEYLAHWNAGEDFPSFGIGHFIWFPEGVDAPFDEQFPALVSYLRKHVPDDLQMPPWMQDLYPFVAPWNSKGQFDELRLSSHMIALRQWLESTRAYQVRFIVSEFYKRWRALELPLQEKQDLNRLLESLFETPEGLFATIDYYNFKGLGDNPREKYQEEGWGLVQVLTTLQELQGDDDKCTDIVGQFRDAAVGRLALRVELSPPERNEARWLAGWQKRLDGYLATVTATVSPEGCGFHIPPYLQNPAKDAITLIWFSKEKRAGQLDLWKTGDDGSVNQIRFDSSPVKAEALLYHPSENCADKSCNASFLPFLHQIRLTDLEPGTRYQYQVSQDQEQMEGSFLTLDDGNQQIRFIVYADSETEPESTGKHTHWPGNNAATRMRRYPLDQTTAYVQNLKVMKERQPVFIAIAGDMVQSGGEQRDWDEFWVHNADLAATTVLLPALGNHDYFGGPGDFGKYATVDSERAVRKFQTYFDFPPNNASDPSHAERYYSLKFGVVTLIVLDTANGLPHRSDMDTNWRLQGEGDGGFAPGWQPGSKQHEWLQEELRQAQLNGQFTFVMFHYSPYTSGVHGRKPGEKPAGDILSAQPLQTLTPLFQRFGVDAVFGGHDEMYEHSIVPGMEISADGNERKHDIHFFDIGIGGDGLRAPVKDVSNPYRVFLAHKDAPEVYGDNGVIEDGGKHYGHLEVNIDRNADGIWQARMEAVYIFPILQPDGRVVDFERRVYADSITLSSH